MMLATEIDGQVYYVKRYYTTPGIGSWVGYDRLTTERRNQIWFRKIGLPAAKLVAYGEERFLSKTIRGALITEAIGESRDLDWISRNNSEKMKDSDWMDQLMTQIAEATRILHSHRFCHNDLRWRNIMVTQGAGNPQIHLIDCPKGKRFFGPFLKFRIIKDLAGLDRDAKKHLSRSRRLRYFMRYRQIDRLSVPDKKMIYQILARHEKWEESRPEEGLVKPEEIPLRQTEHRDKRAKRGQV